MCAHHDPHVEAFVRMHKMWRSMPRVIPLAACLEQEPGASLGFVNPDFDQAGSRDVTVLVAHVMSLTQPACEGLVVVAKFSQHIQRFDVSCVVVQNALGACDVAD